MSEFKTEWNYTELPEGFYSAHLRQTESGDWIFTAYPNRGDGCTERRCDDLAKLQAEIADWIGGAPAPTGWHGYTC